MALTHEQICARRRRWYAANSERLRAAARQRAADNREIIAEKARTQYRSMTRDERRALRRRQMHGLTAAAWAALWLAQDGCCFLCLDPLDPDGMIDVDHDHHCCPAKRSCARCRRGLAHHACNVVIGFAADDPSRLHLIADNLERAIAATAENMQHEVQ